MSFDREHFTRRSGTGGAAEDYEIWTNGLQRVIVRADGSVEFKEISDPAAPGGNKGLFFFRDDGAGKSQFCVRFPTGAIQILATEP